MADELRPQSEQKQSAPPPTEGAGGNFRRSLSKLADRAKELVEGQKAADRQERADLDRIRKRILEQNEQDWTEASRRASALQADLSDELRSERQTAREKLARVKARIEERKKAMKQEDADMRADMAEEYAAEVNAFATDILGEAHIAVIEAVAARKDANDRKAGRAPVH